MLGMLGMCVWVVGVVGDLKKEKSIKEDLRRRVVEKGCR